MAAYGLLIDYEYCTNCGSCQVTCKEEHGYPVGKTGIKVLSDGPWKIDGKRWNWNHFPVLTDLFDGFGITTKDGASLLSLHFRIPDETAEYVAGL